jgi:hypothetical protein
MGARDAAADECPENSRRYYAQAGLTSSPRAGQQPKTVLSDAQFEEIGALINAPPDEADIRAWGARINAEPEKVDIRAWEDDWTAKRNSAKAARDLTIQALRYEVLWADELKPLYPRGRWFFLHGLLKKGLGGRSRNNGGSWLVLAHHVLQNWPEAPEGWKLENLLWCIQNEVPSIEHTVLYDEFRDLFTESERTIAIGRLAAAEIEAANRAKASEVVKDEP